MSKMRTRWATKGRRGSLHIAATRGLLDRVTLPAEMVPNSKDRIVAGRRVNRRVIRVRN